jgi:hypothetical protein
MLIGRREPDRFDHSGLADDVGAELQFIQMENVGNAMRGQTCSASALF